MLVMHISVDGNWNGATGAFMRPTPQAGTLEQRIWQGKVMRKTRHTALSRFFSFSRLRFDTQKKNPQFVIPDIV